MPKIVDHNKYRKELLMKSFDLFAQKGYNAITMRLLAQELGISPATLYHYFVNKEDLFLQLIEEQELQDISNFPADMEIALTLEQRITNLFEFVAKNEDYFRKQILLWIDFYQQQHLSEHQNRKIFGRLGEPTLQGIAEYLEISNMAIARLILNMFNGWLLGRMLFGVEDETLSFVQQAPVLSKMLAAYLEQKQAVKLDLRNARDELSLLQK